MAEWPKAAVLKTAALQGAGGSNPSSSVEQKPDALAASGFFLWITVLFMAETIDLNPRTWHFYKTQQGLICWM